MKILAFDTCLDKMYVALGENGELLASKIVKTTESNYHSAFLISTIKDILNENHLTPQDIDVIATNIGPGSFTGIRACTTVARVFAQGMDIKTVGISSLEILSKITLEEGKGKRKKEKEESKQEVQTCSPVHLFTCSPSKTLVAIDARKEMAYVAIFDGGKQILAPQAISVEELKELKYFPDDPKRFIDHLKMDFFNDRIFIFTPKGDVIDLPENSTPLDFAYSIHSDIGDHTFGSKINGKMSPIFSDLKNGDIVEIITKKNSKPSTKWLEYVKTTIAKKHIRSYLEKNSLLSRLKSFGQS